ncbi:MAG TPA: hypothetical protein VHU15_09540 [Stellaceae bacterium]|jgi:hypothetical protein|nr:hypothetical protein [Stellaceae bacterium]
MPLAQTLSTAFGAALIVLASTIDVPLAQTNSDAGSPSAAHRDSNRIPEKIRPEGSGSSTDPLSNKLDRSGGVLRPPEGVDPGISQAPPKIGPQSTPVIPPPGSSGDSPVKPK